MLDSKEKQTIIYALEEYYKELETQGNIAWRNYVMELTWKVSAMKGERMSKCLECTDTIIVEGEGCSKCLNTLCGSCCEFFKEMLCGDHLVPVKDCGCLR